MNYKGFTGSINFSKPDNVFYGKVENIGDLVSFEGKNLQDLFVEFKLAIDDYLSSIN